MRMPIITVLGRQRLERGRSPGLRSARAAWATDTELSGEEREGGISHRTAGQAFLVDETEDFFFVIANVCYILSNS